jgi:hypothetical protein
MGLQSDGIGSEGAKLQPRPLDRAPSLGGRQRHAVDPLPDQIAERYEVLRSREPFRLAVALCGTRSPIPY